MRVFTRQEKRKMSKSIAETMRNLLEVQDKNNELLMGKMAALEVEVEAQGKALEELELLIREHWGVEWPTKSND